MNKLEELNELLKSGAINQIEYELIKKKLGIEIEKSTKIEVTEEAPNSENVNKEPKTEVIEVKPAADKATEEPKTETNKKEPKLTQKEIPASDTNKKSNVLKWTAIFIFVIALGGIGANLYNQNSLLKSSLENQNEAQELYLKKLERELADKVSEIEEKKTSNQDYKTYARSNASNLNVRANPEISDNIIDMLQMGDRVEVLDTIRIKIETIKQALLNQETFIEIDGKEILFKKGKAFEIINKLGSYYEVIVDDSNNEAIIPKSKLDLVNKEVWLRIKLNNQKKGYVYQRFLSSEISNNEQETYDYYEVYNTYLDEEDYLNLRSEPTSKSINITRMSDGTKLILLSKGNGSNGKWMKVRVLDSGKVGYAHRKWIRKINEE